MLIFIHINKTAGRTVRYILRSTYGMRHCEVEPWHAPWTDPPFSNGDLQRLRRYYSNLDSIAGHRLRGYVDLEDDGSGLNYFTFVRDPLKTCASRFQYNVQYRGKTDLVFEEWIKQDWTRNHQTKMIAGVADVGKAIQIIREKNIFTGITEQFDKSMVLLKALAAPDLNISYRRVNVAKDNTIAEGLLANPRTRAMLDEANQADQKLYRFAAEALMPEYEQAYGSRLARDVAGYRHNRRNDYNKINLTLSRIKQYGLYKPVLYLYRNGLKFV